MEAWLPNLDVNEKYLSRVAEDMSIQTILSFKALLAEFAFELQFRSFVFGRTVFVWFLEVV